MENLLQQLHQADRICSKANVFFEKEADFQAASAAKQKRLKKSTIWLIIGSYLFVGYLQIFLEKILGKIISIPIVIISIPLVVFACWKYRALVKAKINTLNAQAVEADHAGIKILEDNYEDLKFLPDDYWYPLATGYLVKIISTRRADSLKEALDMFDAQLHRWKVEEANAEMVAQQQAQTAHLKSIRTSSKINAFANVMNTMNNMYN